MFRVYLDSTLKATVQKRPPLLLAHGMLSCSEVFVLNSKLSLAYKLAQDGYDIWLGNNRGNIYSRGHVSKYAEGNYFDYTFTQIGQYDYSAMIDYIKSHTNK